MRTEWMASYNLLTFDLIDSTNNEAKKLAQSAPLGNFVVWAKSQKSGRGRMDRSWDSPVGNLYASILIQTDLSIKEQTQASFVSALSVMGDIEEATREQNISLDIRLKWPNDVLIAGKKISGILLESVKAGGGDYLVIGIGVNIASHPEIEDKPATSLNALGLLDIAAQSKLDLIMGFFEKYYAIWREPDGFRKIRDMWLQKAYRLGEVITVSDGKSRISGVFEGINLEGAIELRLASGENCILSACEVFFGESDE